MPARLAWTETMICIVRSRVHPSFISLLLVVLAVTACPDPSERKDEEESAEASLEEAEVEEAGAVEPCTVAAPCPEAAEEVEAISPDDPRIEQALLVDARAAESFESWHVEGARNVVYDILDPTPPEVIHELAAKDASVIVVYGDGDDPDSGEELARDLASQGVENVYFIQGGASVLRDTEEVASQD